MFYEREDFDSLLELVYSGNKENMELAIAIAKGMNIRLKYLIAARGWNELGFVSSMDFCRTVVCWLYDKEIDDLQLLAKAKIIENLRISNCKLRSLSGLQNIQKLTLLRVVNTQIKNLQTFHLPNLTHLDAENIKADFKQKMDFVSQFSQLKYLDFSNNQVDKSDYFAKMYQLNNLFLHQNQLKEVNGLYKLKKLVNLSLKENQIKEIALEKFPILQQLAIDNNQISSLTPAFCPDLSICTAANNYLQIVNFSQNKNILILDLGYNQLEQFELKDKAVLKKLNLMSNFIQELHLENLPQLIELNLAYNPIKTIFLSNLPKLKEIQLSQDMQNKPIHQQIKTQLPKVKILF